MLVCSDAGNFQIKGIRSDTSKTATFRHAIAPISLQEWNSLKGRGVTSGYLNVNGISFAYGDAAVRHSFSLPRGAQRYERGYIDLIIGAMLYELGCRQGEVQLVIMYPPRDEMYVKSYVKALGKSITILPPTGNKADKYALDIRIVGAVDEPLGGLAHLLYTEAGQYRKEVEHIRNQTLLVMDIGGLTTDKVSIDPQFKIDVSSLGSEQIGTLEMLEAFEKSLRQAHADVFRSILKIDPRVLEKALMTGQFPFGGLVLDVSKQAQEARMLLVNKAIEIPMRENAPANYDGIVMTGGGSGLVYEDFASHPYLQGLPVHLVDDPDKVYLANARGAEKLVSLITGGQYGKAKKR